MNYQKVQLLQQYDSILYIFNRSSVSESAESGSSSLKRSVSVKQKSVLTHGNKRESLNQRSNKIFSERFKQNPDEGDLDKVSRATLAINIALEEDKK